MQPVEEKENSEFKPQLENNIVSLPAYAEGLFIQFISLWILVCVYVRTRARRLHVGNTISLNFKDFSFTLESDP